IRLYEASGYLPAIPRDPHGYRRYSPIHLEHARLGQLALRRPALGEQTPLLTLVPRAAAGDFGVAMDRAHQHPARARMGGSYAEAALEFLERWAAGHLIDAQREQVDIGAAARQLGVSADILRGWERNGLISVPRDPTSRYRRYGAAEFGRLRVI